MPSDKDNLIKLPDANFIAICKCEGMSPSDELFRLRLIFGTNPNTLPGLFEPYSRTIDGIEYFFGFKWKNEFPFLTEHLINSLILIWSDELLRNWMLDFLPGNPTEEQYLTRLEEYVQNINNQITDPEISFAFKYWEAKPSFFSFDDNIGPSIPVLYKIDYKFPIEHHLNARPESFKNLALGIFLKKSFLYCKQEISFYHAFNDGIQDNVPRIGFKRPAAAALFCRYQGINLNEWTVNALKKRYVATRLGLGAYRKQIDRFYQAYNSLYQHVPVYAPTGRPYSKPPKKISDIRLDLIECIEMLKTVKSTSLDIAERHLNDIQ